MTSESFSVCPGRYFAEAAVFITISTLLSQVALQRYKYKLHARTILRDLANPFAFYVLKRLRGVNAKAQHNRVRVIVA